jgi:hypothetical protein
MGMVFVAAQGVQNAKCRMQRAERLFFAIHTVF